MQENIAKTATEWVFVARSMAQLPGGESHALRCMARANISAQNITDWITVAKAWAEDFGDLEMFRHCMDKAESVAEISSDRMQIADVWEEMGYPERAIIVRPRTTHPTRTFGLFDSDEGYANPSAPVSEDIVENLGFLISAITRHGTWSRDCLSEHRTGSYARYYRFVVSKSTEITIDLTSGVDTYLFLLNGAMSRGAVLEQNDDGPNGTDSQIRKTLAPGAYTVEATTFGAGEIGNFILRITPEHSSYSSSSTETSRIGTHRNFYTSPAYGDDDDPDDFFDDDDSEVLRWTSLAEYLLQNPSDLSQALHYMAQAEDTAVLTFDWTTIAKSWANNFKDLDNARRCIEQAESVALDAVDWISIADYWAEEFQGYGNVTRCILSAMNAANSVRDWILIAKYHIKKYQIADSLEECFYHAELLAKTNYDWNLIERTASEVNWTTRVNAAKKRMTHEQYTAIYGLY